MKPLGKVLIRWSPEFAYAIGLITTDGSLSIDGRHINFTSKDLELILLFRKCLVINNKIGKKARDKEKIKKYYQVQFGDVNFYNFLVNIIGLTTRKSKTMGQLVIPDKYFFDFLRGHFDGDGTLYGYYDPRWKNSFMYYMVFISASKKHILWLQKTIQRLIGIHGSIDGSGKVYQLRYAKRESRILAQHLYNHRNLPYGMRKFNKLQNLMGEWRNSADSPA